MCIKRMLVGNQSYLPFIMQIQYGWLLLTEGKLKYQGEKMVQNDMILVALKNGEKITQLSALEKFGCLRLSARIWDLRDQGHPIKTRNITTPQGKSIAEYSYDKESAQ